MKNRLKELRARDNLTQEALADALKVSRQTVISLENGKYDPSLKLAFAIAAQFDTTIEEVFLSDDRSDTRSDTVAR